MTYKMQKILATFGNYSLVWYKIAQNVSKKKDLSNMKTDNNTQLAGKVSEKMKSNHTEAND